MGTLMRAQTNKPSQSTTLDYHVDVVNDTVRITLINRGSDTSFLFTSYFSDANKFINDEDDVFESEYLHRYNKKKKTFYLSFIPIVPDLSFHHTDVFHYGKYKLLRSCEILYTFEEIPGRDSLTVRIPRKAIALKEYVKDVDLKQYVYFDGKTLKFKRTKEVPHDEIVVQFAVYKNIDKINEETYYTNTYEFNQIIVDYDIVCVPLNLRELSFMEVLL